MNNKLYPENFDPYRDLQHCLVEVDSHKFTIDKLIEAHNNLGNHVADLYQQNAELAQQLANVNHRLIQLRNAIK